VERLVFQSATKVDSHRFVLHPEPLTITNLEGSRQDQRRCGNGGFVEDKKCSSFGKIIREAP
jgi:hypothetical protein